MALKFHAGERDIQSLRVKCENEEDGCEWVGELRSLEDHLQKCDYIKLPCPNQCDIETGFFYMPEYVFRKDLQKHLKEECPRRQYACPLCKENGEYEDITGTHLLICPKQEINCQNDKCTTTFLREDEQQHLSVCLYEKVICKYNDFGCEAAPLRKDLAAHEEDDKTHLRMTMNTVLAVRKELKEQSSKTTQLEKKLQALTMNLHIKLIEQTAPFTFKMSKFTDKKDNNIEYFSPPFFTHPQGYKLTINVDANGYDKFKGTHISVWAYLMKGEHDDELEFPFKGTITFKLINQLEDKHHHQGSYTHNGTAESSERVTDQERADVAQGVRAFIPHSELGFNAANNCQYLKDDCLVFRIYAEVPSYKPWLQ